MKRAAKYRGEAWAVEMDRGTGRLLPVGGMPGLAPFLDTRAQARDLRKALKNWPRAGVVKVRVTVEVLADRRVRVTQ